MASFPPPRAEVSESTSTVASDGGSEVEANKSRRFSQTVFWLGLGGLIITATILLLMPVPFENERLRELCDLAHLPLFAFLTWSSLMWRAWRDDWKARSGTWKVALFWLGVGSTLEVSQKFFERGTSWEDAIANGLGIAIGLSIFEAQFNKAGQLRIPLIGLATVLFVVGWGWSWYALLHSYR